jgi:hypothetical protein
LQHYGAATGLVDFSRDFLIALWFAAHDNKGNADNKCWLNPNSHQIDHDKQNHLLIGVCLNT